MTPRDIAKAYMVLIEKSKNPLAPSIIMRAHLAVTALGKLMPDFYEGKSEDGEKECADMCERLVKDFTDKDLEEIGHGLPFIMCLCSILSVSIEEFVKEAMK